MEKVLEGIRVLDFSRYGSGPYCGALLADMGAEVIRVESPGGGIDRQFGPFAPNGENIVYGMIMARNKKGITLDLRSDKGKEILKELVKRADIVVENYGAEGKRIMGLDYRSLSEINPAIILVSISGFGAFGPYAKKLAFDNIAQAMSGAMSYGGFPNNPPTRAAVPYADFSSALYGALGAMFALYYREKTGKGQMVDIALLDAAFSMVAGMGVAAEYKLLNYIRPQQGNQGYYCFTNSFKAKDGWVMVMVISNTIWRRFLRVIGRGDLAHDPRFTDDMARYQNREILNAIVSEWVSQRTFDEAVNSLEEARVPCGKVNSIADIIDDPHIRAREMLVELDFPGVGLVPLSGVVPKLSETPGKIERRAPLIGEHNEEIYCGLLGFKKEELRRLKKERVI
jgi:CoA:oxalate CoA-transferase